jgi:hypothetical protein
VNYGGWSAWVVLVVVAMLAGCGEDERDSGIYGSGSSVTIDDGPDDEADEAESTEAGESTSSNDATTDDADETTSTSSDDATSTTTTTDESESEGSGACGNGIIDGGEQCEGPDLAGQSCADLGYTGGTLACDPTICIYDTSACTNDDEDGGNVCDQYCNGCTCPSNECIMCCAQLGKVDTCGGGMCGCF